MKSLSTSRLATLALVSALLAGCGDSEPTQYREADHRTLQQCLGWITVRTNSPLDIRTDKPDRVSGRLRGTDRGFGCDQEHTGTKGIYWLGYYELPAEG